MWFNEISGFTHLFTFYSPQLITCTCLHHHHIFLYLLFFRFQSTSHFLPREMVTSTTIDPDRLAVWLVSDQCDWSSPINCPSSYVLLMVPLGNTWRLRWFPWFPRGGGPWWSLSRDLSSITYASMSFMLWYDLDSTTHLFVNMRARWYRRSSRMPWIMSCHQSSCPPNSWPFCSTQMFQASIHIILSAVLHSFGRLYSFGWRSSLLGGFLLWNALDSFGWSVCFAILCSGLPSPKTSHPSTESHHHVIMYTTIETLVDTMTLPHYSHHRRRHQ